MTDTMTSQNIDLPSCSRAGGKDNIGRPSQTTKMALSRKPFGIGHMFIWSFLPRMTDTMSSQNIVLFSWDTLYIYIAVHTWGSGLPGSGLPRDHSTANRITGQGGRVHKINRQTHTRRAMISHLTHLYGSSGKYMKRKLTLWSLVLEKPIDCQLLDKLHSFLWNTMFQYLFTRARHWSCSESDKYIPFL
jgi:hypothetical protein